jgi:phosphatidylinositol dimannoside acyltransferase
MSRFIKGLGLVTFFYPLRWIVQRLSWRQALRLGVVLGMIHAWLVRDQLGRQILAGLQSVFHREMSEAELRRVVRGNLVARYQHLLEGFFYQDLDPACIEQFVPIVEGRDTLDAALAEGRGAILLASHFGSPGMLVAGLVFRGYWLHQVFTLTPPPQYRTWPWMERAIMQAKLRCWRHDSVGFEFWQPGSYLRPLYRKLHQGAIVVLYGDGARGGHFTQVNFLGLPLSLSVGPFRIAARARVPLIPAFIVRDADGRHRIILEAPIMLPNAEPASLQQGTDTYAALLSRYVRAYPDHWFTWARLHPHQHTEGVSLTLATTEVGRTHFYTPTTHQAT